MKITAIIATPRGMQGNTGRLLDEVLVAFMQEQWPFEREYWEKKRRRA